MDVIQSRNQMALRSSVSQLQGSVRQEIERLRSAVLYETAYLEGALTIRSISVWRVIPRSF